VFSADLRHSAKWPGGGGVGDRLSSVSSPNCRGAIVDQFGSTRSHRRSVWMHGTPRRDSNALLTRAQPVERRAYRSSVHVYNDKYVKARPLSSCHVMSCLRAAASELVHGIFLKLCTPRNVTSACRCVPGFV
jgi:hypothetical protein